MPYPHPLISSELTLLRDYGDYRASVNLAYCPQTVVFAARVAASIISGVFAAVEFDTVTTGAYTDVKPGMTVYIGTSSSIRFAYLNTYVREAADVDTLFIGESAVVVQEDDYIIVVNDYSLRELLLHIEVDGAIKINWNVPFQKPAPLIGNLQSAYIDPRASGTATFTFSPTGYPMAHGATITDWLWNVADGTITVGTTTTQRITATFPQGERWVRVTITDSNGVESYRVFWVNVGLSNTLTEIENPPVAGSLEDGWNMSLNTWDAQGATVLRSLPENTLCVLYVTEIFGNASTAALVTNIMFVGRTRSENGHTVGDDLWSTLQTGTLELEGFGSQLNRLSSPQLSLVHNASPTVWGQCNRPTPPRLIAHLCSYFNTLSTLCSLEFEIPFTYIAATVNADATVTVTDTSILLPGMTVTGTGIPGGTTVLSITNKTTFELSANATATGTPTLTFTPETSDNTFISQSLTITETSAGAALDRVAGWINAGLDHAASGEIEIRRHNFYLDSSAKSARPTVAGIVGGDMIEFSLDIDYPDKVGRVFSGAEFFNTTTGKTEYITGSAPPVARGNGEGQASEDGMILTADIDASSDVTEMNTRTAALYAASQPVDKIEVLFYDAWRGLFVASRSRWYTFTIAASINTMGRVYTTSQRWICNAVAYNLLLETGEVANQATFIREPVTGSAQVASAISPAVVTQALPDLPAISPYPGMDMAGTINYPTDGIPDDEDLQPIDSYSANYGDEEAAGNYPPPGCRNLNILMNDSTGVTTPTLVNAATYTVRASGFGQIDDDGWVQTFDVTAIAAWVANTSFTGGTYMPGVGWVTVDQATPSGGYYRRGWDIEYTGLGSTEFTGFSVTYDYTKGSWNTTGSAFVGAVGATNVWELADTDMVNGVGLVQSWNGSETATSLRVAINTSLDPAAVYSGASTLKSITIRGKGTNPFTMAPGGVVYADAFYYYSPANPSTGFAYTGYGLTFDGGEPNTIPRYNTNHVYNTTITGGGAGQAVKFGDTDYTDNSASTIKVQICGAGL